MRFFLVAALLTFAGCSDSEATPGTAGPGGSNEDGGPLADGGVAEGGDAFAPGGGPINPAPEGTSSLVFPPPGGNVLLGYTRVVRLAQGSAKGTLLATFEHSRTDGGASSYVIRKSVDDGINWSTLATVEDGETGPGHPASTFYQPFLFELPTAIGSYPAGTLLLTGNVLPKTGAFPQTRFQLWRSTDAGATWKFVTTYQAGQAADKRGIWEPFLDVDGSGRLVCYFADERRAGQHSQLIAHVVSADGGDTWSANPDGTTRAEPGLVLDVASGDANHRPGMPTVATLPGGRRVLAYELCEGPRRTCEIYVKISTDGGATWEKGPADLGTFVKTIDGRYPASSPYIVYSPTGQLVLASMRTRRDHDDSVAAEDYQSIFINTLGGRGTWTWAPAPLPVPHEASPSPCYMNYSPHLLMSATGSSLRYTAPSQDPSNPCAVRTATGNAGILPFTSTFESGLAAGWKTYGGCWKVENGIFSETCGGGGIGNKAIAGSTGWQNYKIEGDVRLDDPNANAGFLVRVTDPATGIDAHNGYYVGLFINLFIGRQNYNYVELAATPVPGGVPPTGVFFHMTADVNGCTINATAQRVDGTDPPITASTNIPGCMTIGAVGLRTAGGNASFRNVRVVAR